MNGTSNEEAKRSPKIEVGDYVAHEPHNDNGIIESRVEAVRDDGTIIAEWHGRETYELAPDEVLDHHAL